MNIDELVRYADESVKYAPLGSVFVASLSFITSLASLVVSYFAYRRAGLRRLMITEPENSEVYQEFASVSGINAPRRWKVLVLHRTNRWYLQEGAVTPNNNCWTHEKCHFENSTIGHDRTIVALAVPGKKVDQLREAFGGWGRSGNKKQVHDWAALIELLKTNVGKRYLLSEFKRICRIR